MRRASFYTAIGVSAVAILASCGVLHHILEGLPPYYVLEEYTPSLTTRVYDVREELVAELSIEKRALLSLSEIPKEMRYAVIATEDAQFYSHWGISPRAILRAAVKNFIKGRVVEGASTLTQQLSKLIFLTPERKILRKIREVFLSIQLERNFSKDEILQFYLNQIYFGHGAYGVQAAARIYFGKDVKDLTLSECALLAGMIKSPAGYSPFTHPKLAEGRRRVVLQRMLDEGYITPALLFSALKEPLPMERPALAGTQAPYFVEYVRRQLEPKYGVSVLWRGGLKIYTTLDMKAQRIVDQEMEVTLSSFDVVASSDWAKALAEEQAAGIDPPTISTNPPAHIQGLFLVLDVRTGAIRAMTGGRGDQFNRTIQAQRQPGSTFKPFVWAAALNTGLTGASLVDDAPLAYYYDGRDWRLLEGATDQFAINLATQPFSGSTDFKVWVPNNFDGRFLGVITLRRALQLSRNVTSIRLIEHVGPPKVVELAHHAGIKSRLNPVLALGLGSSVVSPLELANAFETFANGGIHVEPFSVIRVEDSRGKVLETHIPKEEEAISPQTAYLVTQLLKGVVEGGTGVRARELKRPLAGKTGTTNDNRDLWFVGYTPDLLAVAWMGYDDSSSLGRKDLTGGSTVVPWWTRIMSQVLADYPPRDFPVPEDISFQKIDSQTGYLALPTCPKPVLQSFLKGTEPTEYCPFDHSLPLELKPSFSVSGEMGSAAVGNTADQDIPLAPLGEQTPLPTDEQLERMVE